MTQQPNGPDGDDRVRPWRRPDFLELVLTTRAESREGSEADEFGWQVWEGSIYAAWYVDGGVREDLPTDGSGWRGSDPIHDEDTMKLVVGELDRWMRRLDLDDTSDLLEAADAIAQDLLDVVEPIAGRDDVLTQVCYDLTDQDWIDRLLVLRVAEVIPQVRGWGVGAWASARSVQLLAPDAGTLMLTKAAPRDRTPFLADPDRELSPSEQRAWTATQNKIAAYWCQTLGLTPLPDNPAMLIGTLDTMEDAMQATLAVWQRR
ncbi:hypothetical protein [Klenkia soli]|nr:hypothetical protein [Klenkia soli]